MFGEKCEAIACRFRGCRDVLLCYKEKLPQPHSGALHRSLSAFIEQATSALSYWESGELAAVSADDYKTTIDQGELAALASEHEFSGLRAAVVPVVGELLPKPRRISGKRKAPYYDSARTTAPPLFFDTKTDMFGDDDSDTHSDGQEIA